MLQSNTDEEQDGKMNVVNNISVQINQDPSTTTTTSTVQAVTQAPPNFVTPVYAHVYSDSPQTPSKTAPFVIMTRSAVPEFSGGVTLTVTGSGGTIRSFLTVPSTGDYAVQWEAMFLAADSIHQHAAFGIFVNGVLQEATRSGIALFAVQEAACINGDSILHLNAGDQLDLRALIPEGSTQNEIFLTNIVPYPGADQPINSASMRIEKLSTF